LFFKNEATLHGMYNLILTSRIVAGKLVSEYFGETYVQEYER